MFPSTELYNFLSSEGVDASAVREMKCLGDTDDRMWEIVIGTAKISDYSIALGELADALAMYCIQCHYEFFYSSDSRETVISIASLLLRELNRC